MAELRIRRVQAVLRFGALLLVEIFVLSVSREQVSQSPEGFRFLEWILASPRGK
jgi:hypothetical protein